MISATLRKQLVTVGTGMVGGRILAFCQGIVMARLLGPVDLGKYVAMMTVCGVLSRVGDCGLGHAFSYFARKAQDSLGALLRILAFHIGISLAFSAAALVGLRFVPLPAFREVQDSPAWNLILLLLMFAMTMNTLLPIFLVASGEFKKYVMFSNAGILLQILLQVAMYFLMGGGLRALFTANLIAQAVMALILARQLMRMAAGRSDPFPASRWQVYRFGLQAHWGIVMKLLATRIEVPLISTILKPEAVGQYGIAASFREAAFLPQQLYSGIFQNALIDRRKTGNESAGALLIKGLILQSALSSAIALGALLTLPFLIPIIYGPEYAGAAMPAVILAASSLFTGMAGLCWIGFNTANKPHLTSVAATFSGILSPILIYVFASHFGLVGVALSSLAASMVTFTLSIGLTIRQNRFRKSDFAEAFRDIRRMVFKS